MKKTVLCAVFALMGICAFAEKSKLTIKNTFGGDLDSLGDYDLYTHTNETDIDNETVSENIFAIGDRFQVDYDSSLITTRLRLEILYHTASAASETPNFLFAPSGFVLFTPIKQLGIVAGTNFYKQFAFSSGYLAAADDTTKYARLLTDSLGYDNYAGSDSAAVYYNGFGGGVIGNFTFGQNNDIYLKLAAGSMVYVDSATKDMSLDAGLNFGKKNAFDLGFTAHDVLDADRKFGVFAGLNSVPNLILNTGFYYNFTLSDYLPEERVERNDVDEFKKQKTKYAWGLTGGYDFKNIGLGIYADFITGLTNEYIGTIKYYDDDGNLIETVTTTIIRGSTCVKYKDGVAKRTDGFTHAGIPYYGQIRLSFDATDALNISFNFKLRSMWNVTSTTWLTFYPRATIELPANAGEIGAGVRMDMNLTRYEGISSISVPLTYTYKFKKKF